MEVIALSGFARSGKDEVSNILVKEFGFKKVAFADKLREVLYALNPIVAHGWQTKAKDYPFEPVYVQNVIDQYGWDGYKETSYGPEIRRLLQRLGTEAGRETLWDSIWIDAALTGHDEDAKIVISDARFINEFESVISRGGYVWRVDRPGVGPANDHKSETEAIGYEKFSMQIYNDGDLEDLRQVVKYIYNSGQYKEWSYK